MQEDSNIKTSGNNILVEERSDNNNLFLNTDLLKFAFINSFEPMAVLSLEDKRIIDVNQAFCKSTGFEREELVNKLTSECQLWIDQQLALEFIESVIKEGKTDHFSLPFRHKSGIEKQAIISGIQIEVNEKPCLLAIARDIKDYSIYEEHFTDLIDTLKMGIVEDDLNGNLTYFNKNFIDMVSDCQKYECGFSIKSIVFPEDLEKVLGYHKARISGKESISHYEFRLKTKDGNFKYMAVDSIPVKRNNKIVGTRSYIWDISEKKKIENELQEKNEQNELFSQLSSDYIYKALLQKDNLKTIWITGAFDRITGYEPEEIFGNDNMWEQIIHDDHRDDIVKYLKEIIHKKEQVIEYRIRSKTGENIWLKDYMKIVPKGTPGEYFLYGAVQDITNQKHYEESLHQSNEKLKKFNASKNKFFSIIAHDIKTPFNAIKQFSYCLLEDYDVYNEDDRKAFLRNILDASENALDLLQNLLQWSVSQAGNLQAVIKNVDVSIVVGEVINRLKNNAYSKKIIVASKVSYATVVRADQQLLSIVIYNIISNAIKYTNKNGRVIIFTHEYPNYVHLVVEDNGIGMSPEKLAQLFRIDIPSKTEGTWEEGGTGLGLILCREFIEKMQGEIKVSSELGKGSQFTVILPAGEK